MKKNNLWIAIMLIGALLLAGCQSPIDDVRSSSQEDLTQQSSIQESTLQESTSQIKSFYRTENVEELIENVKFNEDGIYISWWNRDCDWYGLGQDWFLIISKEHYNAEDISVTIPIENTYEVDVYEITTDKLHHTMNTNGGVSYGGYPGLYVPIYLYKTYRGINWADMLNWYEPVAGLLDDYESWTEAQKQYYKYDGMYSSDYVDLTTESFAAAPTFYCYNVKIFVSRNEIEESFQTAEIQIGDNTYIQDIGEIRMHPQDPEAEKTEYFQERTILEQYNMIIHPGRYRTYPGGEGSLNMYRGFTGKALTDMTLERMYFYDDTGMEIIGANVKLSSKEQNVQGGSLTMLENVEMDLYWDCNRPLYIPAGNYMEIDIFIKDPDMAKWEYGYGGMIMVEYSGEDGEIYTAYLITEIVRHEQHTNVWTTYAMLVDEEIRENIVRYFDYYRAKSEEWRRGI